MPATRQQKHEAGRHIVVAEALLRGYNAQTIGPSRLVEINGHQAGVYVKTMGSWQISNLDKFLEATTERVVWVELTETRPEFFIMDGDEARAVFSRGQQDWLKRVGGVRPRTPDSTHAGVRSDQVETWRNRWSLFD
jgi:hypothetical protein